MTLIKGELRFFSRQLIIVRHSPKNIMAKTSLNSDQQFPSK